MVKMKKPWLNFIALLLLSLGVLGVYVPRASGADRIGGWKWKAEAGMGFSYDTNVFKLSSTQSDRFDQNRSSDQKSGRFKDMDSIDDFIFSPRIKASFRRPGLGGRAFSLKPSITYNKYVQDQEKSFFEFGLGARQAVDAHSSVGVDFGYAPNIFKKDYLSDAVDKEPRGDPAHGISGSEKVFTAAHYDKTDVTLYLTRRLWKGAGNDKAPLSPDAVSAKVYVGYENRNFDDPFTNRSEDSVLAGLDLGLDLHRHTTLTLSYLFKNISTPVKPEVLVRNELDFGIDFDNDFVLENLNVATLQNVDRSRKQNTVGARITTRLQKGWTGHIKYEARFTSYKSQEPFDVTRIDRNDTRQKFGAGVKGEIAPKWTMAIDWTLTHNAAARDGLALVDKAEGKSYDKNVFSVVVSYLF